MVRTRGLEPPHPKAYEPESYVYTNFTTCALIIKYLNKEKFKKGGADERT